MSNSNAPRLRPFRKFKKTSWEYEKGAGQEKLLRYTEGESVSSKDLELGGVSHCPGQGVRGEGVIAGHGDVHLMFVRCNVDGFKVATLSASFCETCPVLGSEATPGSPRPVRSPPGGAGQTCKGGDPKGFGAGAGPGPPVRLPRNRRPAGARHSPWSSPEPRAAAPQRRRSRHREDQPHLWAAAAAAKPGNILAGQRPLLGQRLRPPRHHRHQRTP